MLGDLGLYIPLVLALSISGQVSLGATLMFSGVANIITGFTFSIPMCVQPMKQIAAVALANNLTMPQIMASGILTGAIVSGLGLTNLITVVNTVIPDSVVRGLQLGMGFQLFKTAMKMLPNSGEVSWDYDDWLAWNGVCACVYYVCVCVSVCVCVCVLYVYVDVVSVCVCVCVLYMYTYIYCVCARACVCVL
jgi:hypothetical protein